MYVITSFPTEKAFNNITGLVKNNPREKALGKPINIGVTIEKNSLRFTIVSKKQIIAENSIIAYVDRNFTYMPSPP